MVDANHGHQEKQSMTTIQSLTLEQVRALAVEAGQAGDTEMVRDCDRLEAAYLGSPESGLSAMVDGAPVEIREAATRIVAALNYAEGMGFEEPDSERTERADHELDAAKDRRGES